MALDQEFGAGVEPNPAALYEWPGDSCGFWYLAFGFLVSVFLFNSTPDFGLPISDSPCRSLVGGLEHGGLDWM